MHHEFPIQFIPLIHTKDKKHNYVLVTKIRSHTLIPELTPFVMLSCDLNQADRVQVETKKISLLTACRLPSQEKLNSCISHIAAI